MTPGYKIFAVVIDFQEQYDRAIEASTNSTKVYQFLGHRQNSSGRIPQIAPADEAFIRQIQMWDNFAMLADRLESLYHDFSEMLTIVLYKTGNQTSKACVTLEVWSHSA
jgi:hypothetical protein